MASETNCPNNSIINTSYQKLPFGSGDYPDKLLYHQQFQFMYITRNQLAKQLEIIDGLQDHLSGQFQLLESTRYQLFKQFQLIDSPRSQVSEQIQLIDSLRSQLSKHCLLYTSPSPRD